MTIKPISVFSISHRWQLMIIQVLNLLPLVKELSWWLVAILLFCFLFQASVYQRNGHQFSQGFKNIIAVVCCALLMIAGRQLGLLNGMLHLLVIAYVLKVFEIKALGDRNQLAILGCLLLSTSLIFYQSIYFFAVLFILLCINLTWWATWFNRVQSIPVQFTYMLKIAVASLPLAILLFVLFPKIPPFWQMPQANRATTGLSDSLTVGDISSLALSDELAFRAEFKDKTPSYQQRYWRVMTLEQFDGKSWQRVKQNFADEQRITAPASSDSLNELVEYQVVAPASFQRWLFALDVAQLTEQNRDIYPLKDYSFISKNKLVKPTSYHMKSDLTAPLMRNYHPRRIAQNLEIDLVANPQLSQYAKQLNQQFSDKQLIINQVLDDFGSKGFRYTLSPPRLQNNSLDQFYFETKSGFCEYYASSFTFLMRAAGIPARVVLGYLGGEYNQQGNYYAVYQRDAHAWSEVWLEHQGWVRVDPTASVDPARVSSGFSSQLLNQQQQLAPFSVKQYLSGALLSYVELYLDALDYQWTKAVINYSLEQQQNLLSKWFGDKFNRKAITTLVAALIVITLSYSLFFWLRQLKSSYLNKVDRLYLTIHLKLMKAGIRRENQETDSHYLEKVKQVNPQLVEALSYYYQQYQYYRHTKDQQKLDAKTVLLAGRKVIKALSQKKQSM